MKNRNLLKWVLLICIVTMQQIHSQNNETYLPNRQLIDSLINSADLEKAKIELSTQLDYYFTNNLDSLPNYVKLVGSYSLAMNNWDKGVKNAENFIQKLKATGDTIVIKNAYLELSHLYDDKGDPKTAYKKAEIALELAKTINNKAKADLEGLYYHLGTKAFNMGEINLSKKHQLKNLALRKKSGDKNHEMYYFTYNSMGRVMWNSGKPDSAIYYFKKAIKSVKLLDSKPWNQYFRPALLNSNLAVIIHAQGDVKKAITITQDAVKLFNLFLKSSTNEADKLNALKRQLAAIDNLGAYFNSIGEYEKAEQLISYSFEQKKKSFDSGDINITFSLMILGQAQMSTQKYEEAENNLLEALDRIEKEKNSSTFYTAFVLSALGNLYKETGDIEKATHFFTRGEKTFRKIMTGNYTKDFLDELTNMALFYAHNGDYKKALNLINEAYEYTNSSSFKGKLQNYTQLTSKAQVHYIIGDYKNALTYASKGLDFLIEKTEKTNKVDSIQIYARKPNNVIVWAKSKYKLADKKDIKLYESLIRVIEESIDILNQRKSILTENEDLNALIKENEELFKFLKQLYQESYALTKHNIYLSKLLSIHESSIYSRIRTRLNQKDVVFSNIPEEVLILEKKKKNKLIKTLKNANNSTISSFFDARKNWNTFLDSISKEYPDYYAMRYGEIVVSLEKTRKIIPEKTTVVRYIFIDNKLKAYVNDGVNEELFSLDDINLQQEIKVINNFTQNIDTVSHSFYKLYNVLWKPFAHKIKTKNIIIIPDADLFNLSFELLTTQKISSLNELKSKSLLNKYNISYNYSLLLLNNKNKLIEYDKDFIAFVPEFDKSMKDAYQLAISDSLELDKTYLTLIPQPFISDIAEKFSKKFNGSAFLNNQASKRLFTKTAKEHKIIHIGTHAESNNISPELSRLVFAKNVSDSTTINDNYLYTYEIYNQNLNSNLAILTACETGKPTYQPGEGMISLAHAFNYAGSESILTSLWQIDEQSSTQILEYFYTYLEEGLPKDEALKNAKLDYLTNAEGRTLHPQYWAGLVLMGDTAPIALNKGFSQWHLALLPLFIILVVIGFLVLRRKRHFNTHA